MTETESTPDPNEGGIVFSRIARLHQLELTPRREQLRRLAAANRLIIDRMVSTGSSATVEQLAEAAAGLERLAAELESLPAGKEYEGFSEVANSGPIPSDDDPERWALFDHSPFIGLSNPLSPPIDMNFLEDRVVATVTFGAAYEGPPGCVHGGYVAAAFDELLGCAQSLSGTQGMTAQLVVNYRTPTPLGQELHLEGRLVRREGRKIYTSGKLMVGDRLCAEAEGLFIMFDSARFQALLAARMDQIG